MRDDDLYELGKKIRREIIGDEYDDQILASENEFSQPIRHWTTVNVFGKVWADETLPRKTRSLINIAMMSAMRCSSEIKNHVRGALNNGCTQEEIRAVLMQVAVYCGVVGVREAVRMANVVFAEEAAKDPNFGKRSREAGTSPADQ